MPISDLLASISGGEATTSTSPSTSPSTTLSRTNTLPKRKASEDIDNVSKTPRTTLSSTVAPRLPAPLPRPRNGETSSPQPKSTLPSRPLDRPRAAPKPYTGTSSKPSVLSARPMNGGNRVTKPAPPSRTSPAPSRAVSAAPSAASRVAPKKGSFAEILARGKLAQASMGQVGKIQHKKVEKGSAPRAKEEPARADPRNPVRKPGGPAAAAGPAYSGTSKLGTRNGPPGQRPRNGTSAHTPPLRNGTNGSAKDGRNGKPATLTKAERAKLQAEEEREKRLKKAAEVTSGYAGTARPKPGNPVKKRDAPRGGALLNTRAPRPAASRSRLEDEYDEELDDFIEYDDDEGDGYGRRYDYASDGSSDMEAGMDDIDDEELRAERIARQEDIAEERLERNLKAAKEERKRQALESIRAGAGRRR